MINPTDFTRGFALLQDRWERQLGEPTIAEYHRILTTELTTEEFNAAVQTIFRHDTFWPSPQRFIEAVRGDPKLEAIKEWDQLLEHAAKGILAPLSEPGKAALRSIGGWPRLQNLTEHDQASARRQFLDSYTTKTTPATPVLPATRRPELPTRGGTNRGETPLKAHT